MDKIRQPARETFLHVLYRFLWPFSHFRDATCGSRLEQSQNYRHNRRMGLHLPGFMVKWAVLTLFFFSLGILCEEALEGRLPAVCCYLTGTCSLTVLVQLAVAWLWLRHFPERH